jgi:1,4-dihydroxy-2-naphthoyl-CoA hydrolase
MAIWKSPISLPTLHQIHKGTAIEHMGIEFTNFGDDWLEARMPVDPRTVQPFGILHGGASVLLAETIGSAASNFCVDREKQYAVGLDINANHLRAAREGFVRGRSQPVHIGRSTHVWQIMIYDEKDQPVCISRLTMSILARP